MARFNEILSGRYNRFVEKLFSMKGPPPMPQVAAELQMVMPFFTGAATRFLEGWQTYWVFDQLAGIGGQFSAVRLRNPQRSGVAAEIFKVFLNANVASPFFFDVRFGLTAVDLATPLGGVNGLDPRAGITQFGPNQFVNNSSCIHSVQNSAADPSIGGRIWEWQVNNAANLYNIDMLIKDEETIPLLPGAAIQVQTPTANGAPINVTWAWRERILEESEAF